MSTMISRIRYSMGPGLLCLRCETTQFHSPHQDQADTSQMKESIEAVRETKDKLFQGLLKAACLGLQFSQLTILPHMEKPAIHSTPYGKYVMNKHLETENPQKRYYQRIFQLPNPPLLGEIILEKGKIILDKEELVVDKEKKISSLKIGGDKILPQEGRRGFH